MQSASPIFLSVLGFAWVVLGFAWVKANKAGFPHRPIKKMIRFEGH